MSLLARIRRALRSDEGIRLVDSPDGDTAATLTLTVNWTADVEEAARTEAQLDEFELVGTTFHCVDDAGEYQQVTLADEEGADVIRAAIAGTAEGEQP